VTLAGKTAVVTGASSGIGRALAAELAQRGHDVVVAAEDAAVEDPTVLGNGTRPALAVRVDLADPEGVQELDRRVRELDRPVDVLCVNAGVGIGDRFVDRPVDEHLRLVDLNVRSAVHLAGLMLPAMVERKAGRVLFTSSIAATMPGPYEATYNASKAFLQLFAQALRVEVQDAGVTVTALQPGPTDTEFFARAGIEDTKLGQSPKDDPRDVAREGLDALFAGKDRVVAGSLKNKVQAGLAKVLPEKATAAAHARFSEPGSAS
jgi:uncharacterized protein